MAKPIIRTTLQLSEEEAGELDALAHELRCSKAEIIRQGIQLVRKHSAEISEQLERDRA